MVYPEEPAEKKLQFVLVPNMSRSRARAVTTIKDKTWSGADGQVSEKAIAAQRAVEECVLRVLEVANAFLIRGTNVFKLASCFLDDRVSKITFPRKQR